MSKQIRVEVAVHFGRRCRGSDRALVEGEAPPPVQPGRTPRVSRWMALAIRFDQLLRDGQLENYAELARLGHVTRARVSQIMNLLNLAPDLQEQLLFLPRTTGRTDTVKLWQLQPIASTLAWGKQRRMWRLVREER